MKKNEMYELSLFSLMGEFKEEVEHEEIIDNVDYSIVRRYYG